LNFEFLLFLDHGDVLGIAQREEFWEERRGFLYTQIWEK
jgi:hypothetical protein